MTDKLKRPRVMMYRDPANGHFRTSVDGCWAYHTCLACPLPRCVYDTSVTPEFVNRLAVHNRISELLEKGETWDDIAATLLISRRTVARQASADRKSKARSPRAAVSVD